jgi:hypothetical protein
MVYKSSLHSDLNARHWMIKTVHLHVPRAILSCYIYSLSKPSWPARETGTKCRSAHFREVSQMWRRRAGHLSEVIELAELYCRQGLSPGSSALEINVFSIPPHAECSLERQSDLGSLERQ